MPRHTRQNLRELEQELLPASPSLNERERLVMAHATGWSSESPLYRNRYTAAEGHEQWATLQGLCERGLMRRPMPDLFVVTMTGIRALRALPNQPKRTKAAAKKLDALISANREEAP